MPRSQFAVGDRPAVAGGVPSHCSTNTWAPTVYPVALIVNATGRRAAFAGTTNGFVLGVVIVAAAATPALNATTGTTMPTITPKRCFQLLRPFDTDTLLFRVGSGVRAPAVAAARTG